MFIGSKKFYFIPDLTADEVRIKSDYVLATEFDNTDITVKVRFLNGDAVQSWAVCETEDEVREAFNKFQEYRKVYWECVENIKPFEEKLKGKYEELYSEYMSKEFAQEISLRHNPNKIVEQKEAEKEANDNAAK